MAFLVAVAVSVDVHAGGPLTHLDRRIADRMFQWDLRHDAFARPLLTIFLYFGQRGVVLVLSLLLLGWLAWRFRTVEPILRLVVALVLIYVVVYGFKLGLARNAPIQDFRGEKAGEGSSYPSGHVANAVVLWGLGDWAVNEWPTPPRMRRLLRGGRWVAPFAVTISMTLLNYHWLSDFLGGAAVGVVLLALVSLPLWTSAAARIDGRLGLRPFAER
ncbi:MAG: phosphoesterase PA-phosphatase related protein [Pseudonocardiales bacterium]|nr:phosphoesterase PA-phosphatase related protein [Pseudonocardiales bacterium]